MDKYWNIVFGAITIRTKMSHCDTHHSPHTVFEAGIDAGYSYQHVFNGERRAKPQEASGGILADEMGLGKSLVTLAVIAGSLDEAERFAGRQEQSDVSQKKNLTQATLIVVPSTCKSCPKIVRKLIL